MKHMLRRLISALSLALLSSACVAQTLSFTFDDGLDPAKQAQAPRWNKQILDSLHSAGVTAMVFPSLARLNGDAGLALIRDWGMQGHAVGNHTASHKSLAAPQMTSGAFIIDVEAADLVLRNLPNWTPMLRFPYLKEGNTAEKRDSVRAWLKAHNYKAAPVSIDASDWYYNQIYSALLDEGSMQKAQQVTQLYIEHLMDRAAYYDRLAQQVLGRSPAHVLLVHTNRINADAIGDVVQAFRVRGWKIVSPLRAFEDAVYAESPDTLPAGESVIWAHAKAKGVANLRYPAEDSVYEEPKLKALGLLTEAKKVP